MRNLRYGMKTLVNRLKPTELNRYRTNLAERRFGMNCGDQLDVKIAIVLTMDVSETGLPGTILA